MREELSLILASAIKIDKKTMTCKLTHRVAAAIFDSDLIATRLLLAFAEFLWAAMLFWPGTPSGA